MCMSSIPCSSHYFTEFTYLKYLSKSRKALKAVKETVKKKEVYEITEKAKTLCVQSIPVAVTII